MRAAANCWSPSVSAPAEGILSGRVTMSNSDLTSNQVLLTSTLTMLRRFVVPRSLCLPCATTRYAARCGGIFPRRTG